MQDSNQQYISMAELCEMLSISNATARNWVRLGKIDAKRNENGRIYFEKTYAEKIRRELISGNNQALRSRRNKTFASGRNIYHSYVSEHATIKKQVVALLRMIDEKKIRMTEAGVRAILADCASQLLDKREDGEHSFMIDDLMGNYRSAIIDFKSANPQLFSIKYEYEPGEDSLGLLYISLKNISSRKATGAYYTPSTIVRKLCEKIFEKHDPAGKRILDPCCGTGNFLISLPRSVKPEQIYGNDLDPVSVCIARINLSLRYGICDREMLYEHVTCRNYLRDFETIKYDIILGNPPWGYAFSAKDSAMLRKKYRAAGKNPESFDVCTEQAIRDLAEGGVLSFVLPEAILSSRVHMEARRLMLRTCDFEYLSYLGNVFDGVHCPSVILQMRRKDSAVALDRASSLADGEAAAVHIHGMEVETDSRSFVIGDGRELKAEQFGLLVTDEENEILRRIADPKGKCYLKDNADFALGIVTGDNEATVSPSKHASNEPILRGTDVLKYRCKDAAYYIEFNAGTLQQAAPESLYRAPEKLVYRFINRELIFAYDDSRMLTLNSCNILIPHIDGIRMKYVLAVLNSRIAQYYFEKNFHSVKVLRSHLEQIPLPMATDEQQQAVIEKVDGLIGEARERRTEGLLRDDPSLLALYNEIDRMIAGYYGLNDEEYRRIIEA